MINEQSHIEQKIFHFNVPYSWKLMKVHPPLVWIVPWESWIFQDTLQKCKSVGKKTFWEYLRIFIIFYFLPDRYEPVLNLKISHRVLDIFDWFCTEFSHINIQSGKEGWKFKTIQGKQVRNMKHNTCHEV